MKNAMILLSFNSCIFTNWNNSVFLNSDHVCMWCNGDRNIKFCLMNLDAVEASFDYSINIDSDENIKEKRCGIRMIDDQEAEEDATIAKGVCQDSPLSIGSHTNKMSIPECHDCSYKELQRLGNNKKTLYSTIADGLCQNSSLSSCSSSEEIIPGPDDCSRNSNSEGYCDCLLSELLKEPTVVTNQPEPSGAETITADEEESHMRRMKRFDICCCLPFLSINMGNV